MEGRPLAGLVGKNLKNNPKINFSLSASHAEGQCLQEHGDLKTCPARKYKKIGCRRVGSAKLRCACAPYGGHGAAPCVCSLWGSEPFAGHSTHQYEKIKPRYCPNIDIPLVLSAAIQRLGGTHISDTFTGPSTFLSHSTSSNITTTVIHSSESASRRPFQHIAHPSPSTAGGRPQPARRSGPWPPP